MLKHKHNLLDLQIVLENYTVLRDYNATHIKDDDKCHHDSNLVFEGMMHQEIWSIK